jgi:hypothetical protein
MPIDIARETVLTFSQAAAQLPRRRRGRKPATSTIHRWATDGLHGIVLESLQCGGTRCTSVPALQRFFERLSERIARHPELVQPEHRERSEAIEEAHQRLDRRLSRAKRTFEGKKPGHGKQSGQDGQ